MRRFVLRRFAFMVMSLIGATAVVFAMSRMTGDPLLLYATPGYGLTPEQEASLRAELHLDKPLVLQYFLWLGNVLHGDLGRTLLDRQKVTVVIGQKIGNTVQLGIGAWLFSVLVGIPLGVVSAVKRGTVWDYAARIFALGGIAAPGFWIGIMAIYFFGVTLHGLLPAGSKNPYDVFPLAWTNVKFFIMPCIVLGWAPAAGFLRITRSAMLEILDSEFIKFARAKGVANRTVIWKHALKNALIPPLTLIALTMAGFITGAVVVETVFSWPGLGSTAVTAVFNNDFALLTGIVLIFIVAFSLANFIADLTYAFIDPRIKYS